MSESATPATKEIRKASSTAAPAWVFSQFENFQSRINGAAEGNVHALRKQALSRLSESGFPTPKNEDWKYTNLNVLGKTEFSVIESDHDCSAVPLQALTKTLLTDSQHPRLVFINGVFSEDCSILQGLGRGVSVRSLRAVLNSPAADADRIFVEGKLARQSAQDERALVMFNTAFIDDGAFVKLADGAVCEKPISLTFVVTEQCADIALFPRVFIQAGRNSRATVIECYAGLSRARYVTTAVSQIDLAADAVIDHYRVQLESEDAIHLSTMDIVQAENSNFATFSISFGGSLVRNDVNPTLEGEHIETTLNGLSVLDGAQHVDNHTVIDHAKPHSVSNEMYKGIYAERSHGVFNGTIIVRPDAQKTNAIQSNQTLLLSDEASIDAKPQLKIWADDVRCTHGATVGQLSEEAMFYLRSRGIDAQAARNMLIRGFASDLIEQIKVKSLAEFLEHTLLEKLHRSRPQAAA